MAQMVKAVRMILGIESFGSVPKLPLQNSFDIEIEDDAPKRNPTLEEIDALEVWLFYPSIFVFVCLIFKIFVSDNNINYKNSCYVQKHSSDAVEIDEWIYSCSVLSKPNI